MSLVNEGLGKIYEWRVKNRQLTLSASKSVILHRLGAWAVRTGGADPRGTTEIHGRMNE